MMKFSEIRKRLAGMPKEKKVKRLLFALSIALTFISLHAGFYFYEAMFGLTVALFSSFTFETLRIATLFGFTRRDGVQKGVSIALYACVAFVCAFASVASFHATIIQNYMEDTKSAMAWEREKIGEIKAEHAKARGALLERINKDKSWCLVKLAANPNSAYWQNRLMQFELEEKRTAAMYDSILSFVPSSDAKGWIERESAKLGIEGDEVEDGYGSSWAMSTAIKDIWNMSDVAAKKLAAIVIVLSVEFGILMLALLSKEQKNVHEFKLNGKLKPVIRRFGMDAVHGFLTVARGSFIDFGRLPLAKELSRRNREIRKALIGQNLSSAEINEIMGI